MRSYKLIYILYILAFFILGWLILTFAYQYIAAFGSLKGIWQAWQESRVLSALYLSITSSLITAFFCLLFGIPAAYLFAVKEFKGKEWLEVLSIDVPQTFPPVAEGMIYLLMLGPSSIFNINLAYTFTALVIAKIYVCVPFIIASTTRKFREIQKSGMPMTARSLGANSFQVFTLVFLLMSIKDILAGAALSWSRAMGELGGSLIFAGVIAYKTEIIPTFIATESQTLTTAALAASLLVTSASTLSLVTFKKLTRQNQ